MKNVNVIHLSTGEQLLAEVTDYPSEGNNTLVIRNPSILVPAGQGKIGLAPYAPYIESESIAINYSNVTWYSEAAEDLANEYSKAFGSGLISVPAGAAAAIPDLKITD